MARRPEQHEIARGLSGIRMSGRVVLTEVGFVFDDPAG